MQFINDQIGFAVGSNGRILRTRNQGITWDEASAPVERDLNAIYRTSGTNGWVCGADGAILSYTGDGDFIGRAQPKKTPDRLKVYPNPASQTIVLEQVNMAGATYQLHTMAGKVVKSGQLSGKQQAVVPVGNLSPGLYLLALTGEQAQKTRKIMIK